MLYYKIEGEDDHGVEEKCVHQEDHGEKNGYVSNLNGGGTCFSSQSLYLVRFIEGKIEVVRSFIKEGKEGLIIALLKIVTAEEVEGRGDIIEETREKERSFLTFNEHMGGS